ncbi:LytTR family DNA-binding domain-containing protein [Caulobacter mirabilis]|uniref:HTH LytTR-type domain-containing protein n=1 Tax=Caulobacter mirabilis TaxID=69666 RepID=A0A2D2AW10_9CAUL|nr:LytTR family DNA-binding domain-containing protein [Caulobacter mirabilis]ATQ42198.1 hypothetical protein CSW64_07100 [Caulobacter mirabilis]
MSEAAHASLESGWRSSGGGAVGRNLVAAAVLLWVGVYVTLHVGWPAPSVDYPVERALRRVLTCGAGAALSLAMIPLLVRAARLPLWRQATVVLGLSLAAQLAHTLFRVVVFYWVDPLWGPLSWDIFLIGLQGAGWVFPMWCAICLAVLADARARRFPSTPAEAAQPTAALWCQDGRARVRVALDEVFLFAAEDDYVRLWTRRKPYLVRARLKDIAAMLPGDRYMQVHRSSIVRLDAVLGVERAGSAWRLKLLDGVETPVSRSNGQAVLGRLREG